MRLLFVNQVALQNPPGTEVAEYPGRTHCVWEMEELQPVADVCALFRDLNEYAEHYFVDTIHANAMGHARIAAVIEPALRELVGPPPDAP